MDKKIHSIRIYQAVTFDKRSETFFSTSEIQNKPGKIIKINKEIGGVEIISAKDHILVPFTNVSCIYFLSDLRKEQAEIAEAGKTKKTGIKSSEISRPKR